MSLDERTVVVTGGTRGIGRAVAGAFAEAGAAVVVGAGDADAVEETVATLEDEGGPDATATGLRADVRDEYDLERLLETASRFGPAGGVDVVVPAAAAYHGDVGETAIGEESYAAFDDHWRTNVRGVFGTITEALAHLAEDARLLVPTAPVAREGTPGYGSYAVSKAGAEAVARAFAADTAYAVGCLDAGPVEPGADGDLRAPDDVGSMFVWAATDLEADALDGSVLEREDWGRATGET